MTTATPTAAIDQRRAEGNSARRFVHYLAASIVTVVTDWAFIGFIIAMPVAVYLFFSGIYGDQQEGGVSAAAVMMVAMAAFGGLGAAMNAGASIQAERSSGWFRQLMLTPLTPTQFVTAKIIASVVVLIPAVGAVFIAGAARGVRLTPSQWAGSFGLLMLALLPMVILGLVFGLWFRPQVATAVTTLSLMGLAMLGGLWFPLELMPPVMQRIGEWLPSHWAATIGQWPMTGGQFPWRGVLVIALWMAVLLVVAALGYGRSVHTSRR